MQKRYTAVILDSKVYARFIVKCGTGICIYSLNPLYFIYFVVVVHTYSHCHKLGLVYELTGCYWFLYCILYFWNSLWHKKFWFILIYLLFITSVWHCYVFSNICSGIYPKTQLWIKVQGHLFVIRQSGLYNEIKVCKHHHATQITEHICSYQYTLYL